MACQRHGAPLQNRQRPQELAGRLQRDDCDEERRSEEDHGAVTGQVLAEARPTPFRPAEDYALLQPAVPATRYPDKTAVFYYGSTIPYGRLQAEVDALAGFLQQHCGVKKGDRVMLYLQNCPQFIIAYYAVLRADAVVVPINPINLTEELRHYVEDAGVSVAVSGTELLPQIGPLTGPGGLQHVIVANYGDYVTDPTDLPIPELIRAPAPAMSVAGATAWRHALAAVCAPGPPQAEPDDLAVLPYTLGTTGRPKGCMHTHATLMATAALAGVWQRAAPDEAILAAVPFFHVTGMQMLMNGPIYIGAGIVVMTRWDRELALLLMERHRVTSWTNVSTMVIDLFASPQFKDDSLRSLRHIGGGGAAMPEAVAKKLYDLTGRAYEEGYGLTETAAPTHINPDDRPKRQCLGIPTCNTESLVVDPATLEPLGPDHVGEIVSRGPQVFKGYWNDPAATAACFVEIAGKTFFRTGDLGRYDEEGYFFLVDRLKRMINAAGFKVWPAELESTMYGHPDIQEACVIGTKDPRRGETVKAVVVLREGARGSVTEADIVGWCREQMAAYKYPRTVEFVDALPRSGSGKVQWRLLQEKERDRQTA